MRYPDGMDRDTFDRATGGGKYEPDMQIRDSVCGHKVYGMVREALHQLSKNNYPHGTSILQSILEYCEYDANTTSEGL